MITLYIWDADRVYSRNIEQSKFAPVLSNSTLVPPPETSGDEVAVWRGNWWEVLPERPEPAPPEPAPVVVPESVTQRQARLMLHRQGALAGVDAVIDAMPEPQRTEARIEWEYASAILRSSPLVTAIGAALNLDDAGLDQLFISASQL